MDLKSSGEIRCFENDGGLFFIQISFSEANLEFFFSKTGKEGIVREIAELP